MRKKLPWLIGLAAITALAAFLRFHLLDKLPPGLWLDEAMNGIDALQALRSGVFGIFYPENGGREGLFINLQALSLAIFGIQPWALRLVSAVFGTLTVPAVYLLSVELFGGARGTEPRRATAVRWIGLTGAFLMAASLWHVMASRIGLRVVAGPFFLTWAMYLLLRTLNAAETADRRPVWPGAVAAGLVYGLGLHSYIAYRVTPLIVLTVFWIYWRSADARRKIAPIFWYFSAAAALAVAPLAGYFFRHPQAFMSRASTVAVWSEPNPTMSILINEAKTVGMFFAQGDQNWRANFAGRPELYWPVGVLFIIGLGIAAWLMARRGTAAAAVPFDLTRGLAMFGAAYAVTPPLLSWVKGGLRPQEIWLLAPSLFVVVPAVILLTVARPGEKSPMVWPRDGLISRRAAGITVAWLLLAALPPILSSEELPHAPRSLLMAPAVFILAAVGAVVLFGSCAERWRDRTGSARGIRLIMATLAFILVTNVGSTYFDLWGRDTNSRQAFLQEWTKASEALNSQPDDRPKFVVVRDPGNILEDAAPMFYPIMFLTDTYSPTEQQRKNLYYLLPGDTAAIPDGAFVITIDASEPEPGGAADSRPQPR